MSYVFSALREMQTVRTASLNLTDLRQGGSKPASPYIAQVIKVVANIQAMALAILHQPATPWTADVLAVGGIVNLAQAFKDKEPQHLLAHGAEMPSTEQACNCSFPDFDRP